MGGVILLLIVVLLVLILAMPALRARFGPGEPAAPIEPKPDEPHEVVVHRLDDHRGKKPGDETKSS
jgi:hypothetical protein